MEITEFQKHIYNTYLKVLAKNSNRPYKNRKNFDKFSEKDRLSLKKLELFFNHHDIDIDRFFQVGFTFYNETFLPLEFFCSYKATVAFRKTKTEHE